MTITLSTGTPSADATGLTAGASYSVYHRGGIEISALIGGAAQTIYANRNGGAVGLTGIPATTLTLRLHTGESAAAAEITELA